jgi:transcriptional regulator with XRE-family HTH domain
MLLPGVSASLRAPKPEVAALRRNTLGTKLKRRRLEQGLRQKDVAPRLGITHATLVNWERDQTAPDVARYPAIITFLGFEPWPEANAFAEKLRAERHRRGWSIAQSAARLGVDEGTFGGWERGTRRPTRSSRSICDRFLREGQ